MRGGKAAKSAKAATGKAAKAQPKKGAVARKTKAKGTAAAAQVKASATAAAAGKKKKGGSTTKAAAKVTKKKTGVAKIFGLAMGSAGRGRGRARAESVVKTVGAAGKAKKSNNNGGIRNNLKRGGGGKGDLRTKLVTKAVRSTTTKSAPLTTGTKVRVSNLHHSVTVGDMTELFLMMGQLKKAPTISKGSCIAVFAKRVDAEKTVAKYNGVELDSRPMKMAIIDTRPAPDVQFTVTL